MADGWKRTSDPDTQRKYYRRKGMGGIFYSVGKERPYYWMEGLESLLVGERITQARATVP